MQYIYLKENCYKLTLTQLTISDCGKSKSEREADTVNQVVGTDADIDKVGFTHKEYE